MTVLDFTAARRTKLEKEYRRRRMMASEAIYNAVPEDGERPIDAINRILSREMPELRKYRKELGKIGNAHS